MSLESRGTHHNRYTMASSTYRTGRLSDGPGNGFTIEPIAIVHPEGMQNFAMDINLLSLPLIVRICQSRLFINAI